MRAPFPWFGGKSRAAARVWAALGDVPNYVEPFAGSLAVLLARPHAPKVETVNDLDAYLANFWRAVSAAPAEVARFADWPVNEADLHARHLWLMGQAEFRERLATDPDYFDARVAGWWVWGLSSWFGTGWCDLSRAKPSRQIPHLSRPGHGAHAVNADLQSDYAALCARLRRVRVACGDWRRVLKDSVLLSPAATCGVFLDPPYAEGDQQYSAGGTGSDVSAEVRAWAIENGGNPRLRIVLAGYEGEHAMPDGWRCREWKALGGYGNAAGNENAKRERLWLSPACLGDEALPLFGGAL